MKRVILVVRKGCVVNVRKFETVTDAYYYYLKEFATLAEWTDYLCCTHKLLNHVYDEENMKYIFKNFFGRNVHLLFDNGR